MYVNNNPIIITKKIALLTIVIFVGIIVSGWAFYWFTNYTKVNIVNHESIPFTLTIGDNERTIKTNTSIWVKNGLYTYQGVAKPDKTEISIVNTLDTNTTKRLTFNYTIYSNDAIRETLCKSINEQSCPIESNQLSVVYVEDYSWAVVKETNPNASPRWAILQLDSGEWSIKRNLESNLGNIGVLGVFPSSVGEVIREN